QVEISGRIDLIRAALSAYPHQPLALICYEPAAPVVTWSGTAVPHIEQSAPGPWSGDVLSRRANLGGRWNAIREGAQDQDRAGRWPRADLLRRGSGQPARDRRLAAASRDDRAFGGATRPAARRVGHHRLSPAGPHPSAACGELS